MNKKPLGTEPDNGPDASLQTSGTAQTERDADMAQIRAIADPEALRAAEIVKQAVFDSKEQRDALHIERKALASRNDVINGAPLLLEDAKEHALAFIDRLRSGELPDAMKEALQALARPRGFRPLHSVNQLHQRPLSLADIDYVAPGRADKRNLHAFLFNRDVLFPDAGGSTLLSREMCWFLFGDAVRAAVESKFEFFAGADFKKAEPGTAAAMTIEERRAEIARNSARLEEIERELQTIEARLDELEPRRHELQFLQPPKYRDIAGWRQSGMG